MDTFNHIIKNPNNWDGIFRLKSEEDRCIFHGIKYYSTMPPIKCFLVMEQLSGGLKMMATLSLLFSIHKYRNMFICEGFWIDIAANTETHVF